MEYLTAFIDYTDTGIPMWLWFPAPGLSHERMHDIDCYEMTHRLLTALAGGARVIGKDDPWSVNRSSDAPAY